MSYAWAVGAWAAGAWIAGSWGDVVTEPEAPTVQVATMFVAHDDRVSAVTTDVNSILVPSEDTTIYVRP